MTNFASFLAASLRLGARLNEAETSAKPYRFTPCYFELAREQNLSDRMTPDGGAD